MQASDHLTELQIEAKEHNERRLAVFRGKPEAAMATLRAWADREAPNLQKWVCIGGYDGQWEQIHRDRSHTLLGRTIDGLVIDATAGICANTIGRSIGAVRGGGLIILLIGDDDWLERPHPIDDRVVVKPYTHNDVGKRFRRRFVHTLNHRPGIAIIESNSGNVLIKGTTDEPPKASTASSITPIEAAHQADAEILDRCLTADQRRCVRAITSLQHSDDAIIVEADRGRGKSSAAGLASADVLQSGQSVLVVGPGYRHVEPVFERASEVLDRPIEHPTDKKARIETSSGATLEFALPHQIDEHVDDVERIVVDEAAAIAVDQLKRIDALEKPTVYLTTIHGYEGTGRGFHVRFMDYLNQSDRSVTHCRLSEPIRYAAADPIEIWQFHALLLDARPPVRHAVTPLSNDRVSYCRVDRDRLATDESRLREVFGLLVLAHYRTEPMDLFRLLDAPNVRIRYLECNGHPVSVALLAEEGDLDEETATSVYRGEPIRGHMIPDLLLTQIRDQHAGEPTGLRYLRIATHNALRSKGLGSRLVREIRREFADEVDYFGAAFGMTPGLLSFWHNLGYHTIHIGTSQNPRSGTRSAVMLDPTSSAGNALFERHTTRLLQRIEGQLPDTMGQTDPETIATALETIAAVPPIDLEPWVLEVIDTMPGGPGQIATAPHGFRRLLVAGLIDGVGDQLTTAERDVVIRRVLFGDSWIEIRREYPNMTPGDLKRLIQSAIEHVSHWKDTRATKQKYRP